MTNQFTYVVHKTGWAVALRPVDEYGRSTREGPWLWVEFPTQEAAQENLESVTLPSTNPNTRTWPDAPHGYYVARTEYFSRVVRRYTGNAEWGDGDGSVHS